jgi:hypothetical protein
VFPNVPGISVIVSLAVVGVPADFGVPPIVGSLLLLA